MSAGERGAAYDTLSIHFRHPCSCSGRARRPTDPVVSFLLPRLAVEQTSHPCRAREYSGRSRARFVATDCRWERHKSQRGRARSDYLRYARAHSDSTCAATGCAWHCASDAERVAVTQWPPQLWSVTTVGFLSQGVRRGAQIRYQVSLTALFGSDARPAPA